MPVTLCVAQIPSTEVQDQNSARPPAKEASVAGSTAYAEGSKDGQLTG